jgi:hypothetical protein
MATSLRSVRAARSAAGATACLCGAGLALALLAGDQPRLAASILHTREDRDGDGLTDQQELVIGTFPDQVDSDGDSFSDLEERARGSEPLDAASVPSNLAIGVNTCASVDDGVLTVAFVVYGDGGRLGQLRYRFGVVHEGRVIDVPLSGIANSRVLVYSGRDAQDRVAVIEVALPEGLVRRFGQLNFFSAVERPGIPPRVSTLSLIDVDGVTVSIERAARTHNSSATQDSASGVVYRPLAADDEIPASWSSGQVCYHRTAPVGVNGASVVHEIEAANCQPMDTYCSGSDCAASVGRSVELPNPGAIAGG